MTVDFNILKRNELRAAGKKKGTKRCRLSGIPDKLQEDTLSGG